MKWAPSVARLEAIAGMKIDDQMLSRRNVHVLAGLDLAASRGSKGANSDASAPFGDGAVKLERTLGVPDG